MIIIVMGVAGSGKTTVGRLLAERLAWPFFDADDFHSAANISRMRAGQPLDDADREQWLADLRRMIEEHLANNESAVLACSALRERYRQALQRPGEPIRWVWLHGEFAAIHRRLTARRNHYMPPALLESQFATLEEPAYAFKVSVSASPPDAVTTIIATFFPEQSDQVHEQEGTRQD